MPETRRIGPWVHALLKSYGVDTVFGIPGVHTVPLYDGLAESGIRHVTPRHEQGAGFMADGYARVSGKPGVCLVITGPGMTNIVTAMGQAYSESVPMLVISSVSRRRHLGMGQGQLHELRDQRALVAGVAAFSHTLHDIADLPRVLNRALSVFEGARPRPVHIEIPLDLWDQAPPDALPAARPAPGRARASDHDLARAAAALGAAARPVILAGGGARSAPEVLRALAERLDAPLVMSVNARGLLPPAHPLAVSASPSLDAVRGLIADSDAVLAVGSELGPTDYDMYETGMPAIPAPLIRIDIEAEQMTRNAVADIALPGDAGATLAALGRALADAPAPVGGGAGRAAAAMAGARAALGPDMQASLRFLETIRDTLPEALIVGDSTQPVYAGNLVFAAARPGSWFNSSSGFGTLGYALPAALGAALAAPERPVVCLTGDGGLHYTLGELASLRQAGAPVIVIVWNNESYGEIKSAMLAQGVTPVGVDLFTPDLEMLGQAYGLATARLERLEDFAALLERAARDGRACLMRVDEATVRGRG